MRHKTKQVKSHTCALNEGHGQSAVNKDLAVPSDIIPTVKA